MSLNDVTNAEGKFGTRSFTFTVSVNVATANGSAIATEDYISVSGTLGFNAGEMTKTIVFDVIGDRKREPDESFSVNLSGESGATILDASEAGRIPNHDR
jgi:hypothetical protein